MDSDLMTCVLCNKEYRTYTGSKHCSDCFRHKLAEMNKKIDLNQIQLNQQGSNQGSLYTNQEVNASDVRQLESLLYLLLIALILILPSLIYGIREDISSEFFYWHILISIVSFIFVLIEKKLSIIERNSDLSVVFTGATILALIAASFMYGTGAYDDEHWFLWLLGGFYAWWISVLLIFAILLCAEFEPEYVGYSGVGQAPTAPNYTPGLTQNVISHSTAGYYECLCGEIQHASRWSGARKCSRCGKNMIWRR